jgi:beta-lactamase class C
MKLRSRFALVAALLLAVSSLVTAGDRQELAAPSPVKTSDIDDRLSGLLQQFDGRVRHTLADERIPGAAWVVVHDGGIAALATYGHVDRQRSRPIDSRTVFRIASVSKGFAGVLAALLAREGRFSLAEPVAPYAPSFGFRTDEVRRLTVQDVLGQRSGFVPNAYDNLIEAGRSRQDIYPRFAEIDPICAPGACYSYQNSVFSLIEDVVERSTSVPYPELVEQRLFQPLGMNEASLGYEAFMAETNRADPHLKTRTGWRRSSPRRTYYQVSSAAGINASIRGYGRVGSGHARTSTRGHFRTRHRRRPHAAHSNEP